MHLMQLVCSMTSIPKYEGHNVPRRRPKLGPRIRGWSARPTGLRSVHARLRKKRGSHGLSTMPCEGTGGGLHAANNRHLNLPRSPRRRCSGATRNVSFQLLTLKRQGQTARRNCAVSLRPAGLTALSYPWLIEPLNPTFL